MDYCLFILLYFHINCIDFLSIIDRRAQYLPLLIVIHVLGRDRLSRRLIQS